jgi:16S rRNA (cytosine1402-N4)-methyltransferase
VPGRISLTPVRPLHKRCTRGWALDYPHRPVLVREAVDLLVSDAEGTYVDGTVGTGGHSLEIGNRLAQGGRLICLDRDPDAVRLSRERLSSLEDKVQVIRANYRDLDQVLSGMGVKEVNGVLLDLGMSSLQLERSGRGFSFSREEPLDMRMDPDGEVTAWKLINELPQKELEEILGKYGEERKGRLIARGIVRERKKVSIETSDQLADLIASIIPRYRRSAARHPATRTFQALRIAVNGELDNLEDFLRKIPSWVRKGGRLVVLSYHSLEDRLVKQAMKNWEDRCTCSPDMPYCTCRKVPLFRRLTKKGIKPDEQEIEENPRARSAILRAAERV